MKNKNIDTAFCLLKEKVETGKILTFEVASGYSMFPLLSRGDRALVRNVEFQGLRKGDIIIYRTNESLCIHRLIRKLKKDNNCFALITKGDNIYHFDQLPVSKEQLVGKVIAIRKNNKTINLEEMPWKIINYLLASISAIQAYLPIALRVMRRAFLRNKNFPPGITIKKMSSFILFIPLKIIVYITKIVPLFYKKVQS